MNIGIVCYPTFGGSGVMATELGKFLAQKGHNIHFITYSRPIRLEHFVQNVSFHEVRVPNYPLFEYPPYESALASTMVDVARYQQIDLFHVHYAIPHASAGYLAREILKGMGRYVPVITTLHGTDISLVGKDKSYEPVVAFSINQSDRVTAVSSYLKEDTYTFCDIKKEIEVVPNFVDVDRFRRHDKEHFRKMVAPNREKLLIHTSNFRKVKRVQDVLKVFDKVRKEMPAKLLMIGDGPERTKAEAMCREMGSCDRVHFLGNTNPLEEIYSIGDLFIMPSESESFGLSALEAMACGTPVISSNAGGLPELIRHGETGYVCDVGATDKMAEYAISLLNDSALWEQFSSNARKIAETYAPETVVEMYEFIYKDVMAQKVVTNVGGI